MWWGFSSRICSGPRLYWPAGLPLPLLGLPSKETTRQLQWGQVHNLQHADLLCCLGGLHPSLHQLSREVCCGCGDLCHPGFELWPVSLYFCSQMLHNLAEARKKLSKTSNVKDICAMIKFHPPFWAAIGKIFITYYLYFLQSFIVEMYLLTQSYHKVPGLLFNNFSNNIYTCQKCFPFLLYLLL